MTDHTHPTVEQFLASSEPDEDDTPDAPEQETGMWAALRQLPPDPMERIAAALERMAGGETFAAELNSTVSYDSEIAQVHREESHTYSHDAELWKEQAQSLTEHLADGNAKLQTLTQVISDVEAALGKSTAKPALAAKAVIDEWRNPQVPEVELTGDPETDAILVDPEAMAAIALAEAEMLPGHTQASTGDGSPDFCQECSYAAQDYVQWPCPTITEAFHPLGEQVPVQPEHNAPVEEWRAYAKKVGYAGPDIDKANRSVIRTALGIAQPVTDQTAGA